MVGHRRLRIRRVNRCAIERDNRPFCAIPHRYAIGPGVRNLAEERALRARARAGKRYLLSRRAAKHAKR